MENTHGAFIVIEGTDGAGKTTQFNLLAEHLIKAGYDVATFKFPRYDEPSSYFVREYLSGAYGSADAIGPYTASLFYALDRFASAPLIREALADGKIVLVDRYVGANMAHQGTKFRNAEERRGFFIWLDNLEFEMLRIPRPDATLVLRVPAAVAEQRITNRGQERDIHEVDPSHLERAVTVYDDLTQLFPKDFMRVDCTRNEELLDIPTIQRLIWQKVEPLLPPPNERSETTDASEAMGTMTIDHSTPDESVTVEATLAEPLLQRNEDGSVDITSAGDAYLAKVLSNSKDNVYAFTDTLSSATTAAAMTRLSQDDGDMRAAILDEFATAAEEDKKLLRHAMDSASDSLRQLAGLHVVVERASSIVARKLTWSHLANSTEQLAKHAHFDQKDADGHYKYFVPEFSTEAAEIYRAGMDDIFTTYAMVMQQLTEYLSTISTTPAADRDEAWKQSIHIQACNAAQSLLPVAATTNVGIFAPAHTLESIVTALLSDELPEARAVGAKLLAEAHKILPTFLESTDKPDGRGTVIAYRSNTRRAVQRLAESYLPNNHTLDTQKAVKLTDVWPRNELDLVADMLYEQSDLSLVELRSIAATWTYAQKASVVETYIGQRANRRHSPGSTLEKVRYSWDILCDYATFCDLQRHQTVDDLGWQQPTPRYGYELPQLIEDAGLTDLFESAFDASLKLYSLLQQHGYAQEAQYATLFGHRMRWKMTYNARQAFHLYELDFSTEIHQGYRTLVREMHEKLAGAHPLLGGAMQFADREDDNQVVESTPLLETIYSTN